MKYMGRVCGGALILLWTGYYLAKRSTGGLINGWDYGVFGVFILLCVAFFDLDGNCFLERKKGKIKRAGRLFFGYPAKRKGEST